MLKIKGFEILFDVFLETLGVNTEKLEVKENIKKEKELILTIRKRVLITFIGILFFAVSTAMIYTGFELNNIFIIAFYSFLLALDFLILISLWLRKKSADKISLFCISLFILFNFAGIKILF